MHRFVGTILFLVFVCLLPVVNGADSFPLRPAVECHPRGGLPNVVSKLKKGSEVRIGYLGGSITAAAGWRVHSRAWFQEQYPDADVKEIHAAIGGTGSDLGVFRLNNDVLRHKPDLLFVEFAVNDGGAPPERIHKAMEGIVRQTWKTDSDIDICYVYTLSQPMLPDLHAGRMPRAASAMEMLADHYQIPSIHFGVKVVAMEKAGELVFKAPKPKDLAGTKPMVFSSDGVHPHSETGHRVYAETIARSWPAILKAGGKPAPHKLGKSFRKDHWAQAKQIAIDESMLKGDWEKMPAKEGLGKRFNRNMPQLFRAGSNGASLEFTLKGSAAAVFDLLGPDGGRLEVLVGDKGPRTANRIDGYCTYHRMSKLNLINDAADGSYRVKVTLLPEKLDKRKILFERNREYYDKNEGRYEDHTWYVSSLLVIGEIE